MYIWLSYVFFLKRQRTMTIEPDKNIEQILNVHHALWDMKPEVIYFGNSYKVKHADHKGYSSVILPGKSGKNILVITQNLNKSTYGTLEIQRAATLGQTTRITWIVDTSMGGFNYVGVVKTCFDFTVVERYDQYGTHTVYHTNPKFQPVKSAY